MIGTTHFHAGHLHSAIANRTVAALRGKDSAARMLRGVSSNLAQLLQIAVSSALGLTILAWLPRELPGQPDRLAVAV